MGLMGLKHGSKAFMSSEVSYATSSVDSESCGVGPCRRHGTPRFGEYVA